MTDKITLAITGASGAQYGLRLLECVLAQGCDVDLLISKAAEVVINTETTQWQPGLGNLKVMPLHQFEGRNTALVLLSKGERFLPDQHRGGQEVLVLSGALKDQHGCYPKGTWIRSPHLSEHLPFVEEDTMILVKVGHF